MPKIIQLLGTDPGFQPGPHSKLQQNTRGLAKMSSARMNQNTSVGARNVVFCKNVPPSSSKSAEKVTLSPQCSWEPYWREMRDRRIAQLEGNLMAIQGQPPLHYGGAKRLSANAQTLAETRSLLLPNLFSHSSLLSSTSLGKLTESVEIENVFFLLSRDARGSMYTCSHSSTVRAKHLNQPICPPVGEWMHTI